MSTVIVITILCLFGIGFYFLLITRNLIKLVIALQILVKAAMLGVILAGSITGNMDLAQSLALTVIIADTIVAVIALAISVQVRQLNGTIDVETLTKLRR